jgi:hypothetical protein
MTCVPQSDHSTIDAPDLIISPVLNDLLEHPDVVSFIGKINDSGLGISAHRFE